MRYNGRWGTRMEGGWMRGRGYVGQFSRNSMGRDRHSNPRYPRSTPSGSCSLFKQASNSILGSYPFSLTLTPFRFAFPPRVPLPPPPPPLVFPASLSLLRAIRLSAALAYRIRLSLPPSLSFETLSQLKSATGTPGFQQLR